MEAAPGGAPARAPAPVPALECLAVSLAYDRRPVLEEIDLAVSAGETVALLGPSGSGKTSLLYAVAGFLPTDAGEIRIAGRVVSGGGRLVPPDRRDAAFVFQHYALWPHLSALETVAYPLRRQHVGPDDARRRAQGLLELMGVGALAGRRPAELSGGEQQRVGIARALAREAGLVLLDEPTAHLDTPLRAALMAEVADQRRRSGAAAIYATHDVGEALAVADRVALLRAGRIVQVGTPAQIYQRPVDLEAARLSGPASVLEADVVSGPAGTMRIGGAAANVELGAAAASLVSGPCQLLVRPDWARLGGELEGVVTGAWYRGPHTDYRLATGAGELELRELGSPRATVGERVRWTLERAWPVEGRPQS